MKTYVYKNICNIYCTYHETVGKDLDTSGAKGGSSELKITKVTREDLSGHGHDIVDHINDNSRCCEMEEVL